MFQVIPDGLGSHLYVPCLYRCQYRLMAVYSPENVVRYVDTLDPVTHHVAPEGLGQLQKSLAPAHAGNNFVKLRIKIHVCPHFALPDTLLSRGNILLEVVDELLVVLLNGPADGQGLDRCSDLAYFLNFPVAYGVYLVADPWYRFKKTFHFERMKGLSHGRSGCAYLFCDLCFYESLVGPNLTAEYLFPQVGVDLSADGRAIRDDELFHS